MAPVYRIAVIQLNVKPLQAAKNFEKSANFIRSAAAQGCHLAVLPEFHLTNWLPTDPRFPAAIADWETYLHKYQDLARQLSICIVPGSFVRPRIPTPSAPQPFDNITYFISSDGSILGSYIKKNLWGPSERPFLATGHPTPNPTIDTPIGKVALLICWDVAFPEAFREVITTGAKIVIIPSLWPRTGVLKSSLRWNPSEPALFIDSMMTARSYENSCCVVFANAGGRGGGNYVGLSQITTPYIGPLCRLGGSAEGMAVADVDMQVLEDAEENVCVRADLKEGGPLEGYVRERTLGKL